MAIVDELIAILGYKIEGKDKLREFQSGLDQAEKKSKSSAKAHEAQMASASRTGAKVGVAISAGVAAAAALSVKAVKDFAAYELQLTRIGITAGITQQETMRTGDDLQRMAQKYAMPLSSVMEGMNVLTASGKTLKESMDFLPSILLTAQASGAAVSDIANTAIKASDALKIPAAGMQKAFDIMVEGGKSGQFELEHMAQFLPDLANSFSTLGYRGEEGLQKLIALAQTVRERTATAGQAATSLGDVFGKIYAPATASAFKKMGVDLGAEMDKAKRNGEDLVQAFLRITRKTTKGNMELLPKLFADKEFRRGMQALLDGADDYKKHIAAVSGTQVDGSALRDYGRIVDLTAMRLQKLETAADRAMKSLGGNLAPMLTGGLDSATDRMDYSAAVERWDRANWLRCWRWAMARHHSENCVDQRAYGGGFCTRHGNWRHDHGFPTGQPRPIGKCGRRYGPRGAGDRRTSRGGPSRGQCCRSGCAPRSHELRTG